MSWLHKTLRYSLWLGLIAPLYAGCAGAGGSNAESSGAGDDHGFPSSPSSKDAGTGASKPSGAGKTPTTAGPVDDLPAEMELPLSFQTPQAGKSSVYVPNPTANRVAVVNAGTFNIENLPIGGTPTFAATVPGKDLALVLNVGSRDAALLRTNDQGHTTPLQLAVGHDANAIAIAPDGTHAIIYRDAAATGSTVGQSFQDLTIIDLTEGAEKSTHVSVGFRPRGVQFSRDGSHAYVVTEDGISVLDFAALAAGPSIARLVPVGDSLSDAQSIDVQVTPDGLYALARREGDSTLRLINLTDGTIQKLALGNLAIPSSNGDAGVPDAGAPAAGDAAVDGGVAAQAALTDLDLAPDGTFAIAVLRDRGALVRIPLPGAFADPSKLSVRVISDQLIGSVTLSKSGTRAVAYTTVAPVDSIVVVDLTSDAAPKGIRLRKSVRAVALTDDGARALVLHATEGNLANATDEDARIAASQGYSLVDTASGFAKLQLTAAQVSERGLLLTPDGLRVFALLGNTAVKSVEMADLQSFQVTSVALSTAPTSIGLVPGLARVFVGQADEGGITFLDANTGMKIRSVSGFEIASRIRQ